MTLFAILLVAAGWAEDSLGPPPPGSPMVPTVEVPEAAPQPPADDVIPLAKRKKDCLAGVCLGGAPQPNKVVVKGPLNSMWQREVEVCGGQIVFIMLTRVYLPPSQHVTYPESIITRTSNRVAAVDDHERIDKLLVGLDWTLVKATPAEPEGVHFIYAKPDINGVRNLLVSRDVTEFGVPFSMLFVATALVNRQELCAAQERRGL